MSERGEAPETGATLEAALAATRRAFDGSSERTRETERRILASMRGAKRTRRVFWMAPLAAAFVVSAAFADELGGRFADLKTRLLGDEAGPPTRASSSTRAAAAPPSTTPVAPAASDSAPAPAEAAPRPIEATAREPSIDAGTVRSIRPAPSSHAPTTEAVDDFALYKEAHRAHFVDRDYARALAGWDRYLAVAPSGTFSLEARYNRAIALYRLGRRAAALEALRPFADGAYGRYRRDEARELVEELR